LYLKKGRLWRQWQCHLHLTRSATTLSPPRLLLLLQQHHPYYFLLDNKGVGEAKREMRCCSTGNANNNTNNNNTNTNTNTAFPTARRREKRA
jgi:hypothetical protein